MPIIPPEVADWLQGLSRAFHSTSWESCEYLLIGLLYGHARSSVVRSAQLAPDDYNWRRLHDLLRIGRWKGPELVAVLIAQILQTVYPVALPDRLWWVLDITEKEKAFAEKIPGIKAHYRGVRGRRQSKTSWSHRYLVLGLLATVKPRWHTLICSVALLWGRRTFQQQAKSFLVHSLPQRPGVVHTLVADRYFGSTRFLTTVQQTPCEGVVRLKCNFKICRLPKPRPPEKKAPPGRPPEYGAEYRVDKLPLRGLKRTRHRRRIGNQQYGVTVWRGTFLRRGLGPLEILTIRWGRHGYMWLAATDATLTTTEILDGYNGRWSVEPAIHEMKDLGLGCYRGRRMAGVRRHPLLVAAMHSLLSLIALGYLKVDLPLMNWDWYPQETTVGQTQRRLLKWFQHNSEFRSTSPTTKSEKTSRRPRPSRRKAA
jgi:hypothetical protein